MRSFLEAIGFLSAGYLVGGLAVFLVVFPLMGCIKDSTNGASKPMKPAELTSHPEGGFSSSNGSGFESFAKSEGMTIHWAGLTSNGAHPLDAINATIARLQFEQDTDGLASDSNARAMAHMMLARQELEGKQTQTDDGFPILE